jgi:hypothetical protein
MPLIQGSEREREREREKVIGPEIRRRLPVALPVGSKSAELHKTANEGSFG